MTGRSSASGWPRENGVDLRAPDVSSESDSEKRRGRRGIPAWNRDWREGGTSWTQDYPRADRHFSMALRRLTRLHVRSVEQPVNLEDGDDVFNWPWMAVGEMGDWLLTPPQAAKLRDYLLRGGFLYMDDFWGQNEWDRFMVSMNAVFPGPADCRDRKRGRDLPFGLRSG